MATEAERAKAVNQSRDLLIAMAELTLTQLGIPGALACWAYLAGRWHVHTERNGADPERS
jgi:hypothetical protein